MVFEKVPLRGKDPFGGRKQETHFGQLLSNEVNTSSDGWKSGVKALAMAFEYHIVTETVETIVQTTEMNEAEQIYPSFLLKRVTAWEVLVKVTLYSLLLTCSFVGNAMVVYVVVCNNRMRTTTNYYILNLAVSDLLVTFSCMWVHLVDDLTEGWVLGKFFCKFNSFAQVFSLVSSVMNLTFIAYDRFFGIVFALKAHMTERRARYSILFIWMAAIVVASPLLMHRRMHKRVWANHVEMWCDDEWPVEVEFDHRYNVTTGTSPTRKFYYTFVFVVLYAIPMVIMIGAYTVIIWRLWVSHIPGEHISDEKTVQEKVKRRVIIMLVILMTVFGVCWLPFQIIIMYSEHRPDQLAPLGPWFNQFHFIALYLAYANSAINPIIYAWFNENFRRGFKDAVRTLTCRKGYNTIDGRVESSTQGFTLVTRS